MMKTLKTVTLRCEDNAEALVFNKYDYERYDTDYEINIEDSYCGGDFMGIKGRFKRAWHAFKAKPIYYTGIYSSDENQIRKFLQDCLDLIDQKSENTSFKNTYMSDSEYVIDEMEA